MGSFKCGGYLYNVTRASRVEGTTGRTNVDRRAFDSRWKEVGDIALYRKITEHSVPQQTDRFVEKRKRAHHHFRESWIRISATYLSEDDAPKSALGR